MKINYLTKDRPMLINDHHRFACMKRSHAPREKSSTVAQYGSAPNIKEEEVVELKIHLFVGNYNDPIF